MAQASPQGPVGGWVQMVPCSRCGQSIDPTKAVYSKQGELVCKACESADILTDGYLRAAKGMCYGALGTGLLSIFFNPIYVFSVAALITGVRALMLVNRTEYRSALGGATGPLITAAIVGIIAGGVQPALATMALLGAFMR